MCGCVLNVNGHHYWLVNGHHYWLVNGHHYWLGLSVFGLDGFYLGSCYYPIVGSKLNLVIYNHICYTHTPIQVSDWVIIAHEPNHKIYLLTPMFGR